MIRRTSVIVVLASTAGAQEFTVDSIPLLVADHRVALGDADGDGDLDAVVRSGWFLAGDGDGTLAPPVHHGIDTGSDFAMGDLDGDGRADLAAASTFFGVFLGVSLTTEAGGASPWGPASLYAAQDVGNACALGDVDGDGHLDVFTGYGDVFSPGGFQVHRNDGAGGFPTSFVRSLPGFVQWIATADVDGDGFTDVAGTHFASQMRFCRAVGDGTLDAAQDVVVAGETLTSLTAGDLDGDGDGELVVSNIQVHALDWSSTSGLFLAKSTAQGVASARHALADFDGDGRLDLAARRPFAGVVPAGLALLSGDGALGFGAPSEHPGPGVATNLTGADLDGDGRPDLVAMHESFPPRLDLYVDVSGAAPWTAVGSGLAGTNGLPALTGVGALAPGPPPTLAVTQARAEAATVLVLGGSQVALPLLGGVLVPGPELLIDGLATDATGQLVWSAAFPAGVAPGLPLYAQAWIRDPVGPHGWAATAGRVATTP